MKKTIIDYLEIQVLQNATKILFQEEDRKMSYSEFWNRIIGLAEKIQSIVPIKGKTLIMIPKSIDCLIGMFGTLLCGCIYCVVDTESPSERLREIERTYQPDLILTCSSQMQKIDEVQFHCKNIINIDQENSVSKDTTAIEDRRKKVIDTDAAYVLFTSGSTGVPKGTIVSHRSILNYASTIANTFHLDESVVFGSQTPFYFSMSVLDIFVTVLLGGTLVLIPKKCFSFPYMLIEYLNKMSVNTIYWVPTALSIVANRKTFSAILPTTLKRVFFAGEVMPVKQLNYWMEYLPDCLYANLYGPTEITDTGTYYVVQNQIDINKSVPIGIPFDNCDVFLLNEDDQLALEGQEGEICFRGSFLGYGYYNNWEKTKEAFCQNPLNSNYPEIIYRTGDLGRYDENGDLIYISRKDFQIKRMGYRIELGEIESTLAAIPEVQNCVCVFDAKKNRLALFYSGGLSEEDMQLQVEKLLLKYMQPDFIFRRKSIPINANGKFDRKMLLQEFVEGE